MALPEKGLLVLVATDEFTGRDIQLILNASSISKDSGAELLASTKCIHTKSEEAEITGVLSLQAETDLKTLKNFKSWLYDGDTFLLDLDLEDNAEERRDLTRLARSLKVSKLAEKLVNKKSRKKSPEPHSSSEDAADLAVAARVASATVSAADAPALNTLLTKEKAAALDKSVTEYTAGLQAILKDGTFSRPQSGLTLEELQAYCSGIINLHVFPANKSKQEFAKRYFGSFVTAEDATKGFRVENGQEMLPGDEVAQTLEAVRKWWREIMKQGVVHLEPQITSQTSGIQYQSRFRSKPGGSLVTPTISGSPDVILSPRQRDEKGDWKRCAIYDDAQHRVQKQDGGLSNWKTLLSREELRSASETSPADFESKPSKSPLAGGQVMSNNINANALASRPVVTVRTDFNEEYDICVPEEGHLMLYQNVPAEYATPFIVKWLKVQVDDLPRRCRAGHLLICGALSAAEPYSKESLSRFRRRTYNRT